MDRQKLKQLIEKANEPLPSLDIFQQELYGRIELYYRFLYHLVLEFKPEISLEIGVYNGIASLYMAAAAKQYNGKVFGIDLNFPSLLHRDYFDRTNGYFGGTYRFFQGDSTDLKIAQDIKESIENFEGKLQLIYQDSSHHYVESKMEWLAYSLLADDTYIWICDDITPDFHDSNCDPPNKSMVNYWEELPGQKMLSESLHFGNRMGILFNVK